MARKRKGKDISGWVIIDKPAGLTSTAVVNKVRWAFEAKKAGHAGTLDPSATGLLAVALGEATKTIPYITNSMKAYSFDVVLGAATNTDDAEGEVIETSNKRPTDAEVAGALQGFLGDITQVPPKYSAVKIDGQRAYKLARAGEDVSIEPRPLFVEELLLIDRISADLIRLEMTCGKGGYVRSVARDLGEVLGCLAHVKTLHRIWSGPFDLANAVTLEQIEDLARTAEIQMLLRPLEDGLADLPEMTTTSEGAVKLGHGNPGISFGTADYGDEIWVSHNAKAVAIGVYKGGECHPSRVINQVPSD